MDLWQEVLDQIQHKISKPSFETWLSGTSAEIEDDVITVVSKNDFASSWLEEHYKTLIFETVREIANQTYEIEFTSHDEVISSKDTLQNFTESDDDTWKKLIVVQGELLKKQQEKIEELEKRVHQLEGIK